MNGLIIYILCMIAIICAASIVGGLCGTSYKMFMSEETLEKLDPPCLIPYAIVLLVIYVVAAYYLWQAKIMIPKTK